MRTSRRDRTPKKKGAEQSYWVKSHKEKDGFIPRAYYDEQNETNLLPRVFTHQCALIAESCTKEGTNVPSYLQANEQYIFMHPDTMQLSGFTVTQLIAIHSPSLHQTAVGKLLPSNQLHPSKVLLSNTIIYNCQINCGELVQLALYNTTPPVAETVELKPCQPLSFPVGTEFKSYLLSRLDGSVVSEGQEVQVQYLGSTHWLQVTSVNSATANAASCHDALSLDMSNMSLNVDCSTDSIETSHDTAGAAEFSANYSNFFIITHCSQIIIQTTPSGVPRIALDWIRGMDKQVKLLYEIVVIPLSAPDAFKSRGIDLPRGLLLYGVKGVGKSLLAQAVADKSGAHVISVASQQALLCIDTKLTKITGGCVVVVIEALDVVCPRLDPSSSETHRQAVTTVIDLFDAMHKMMNYAVVMATTNKLDAVEASLRTPGRFDKEIEITVPDPLERKQVLEFCLKDVPHNLNEADIIDVADAAHGYVRGDLVQLCKEAQCGALSRALQHGQWKESLLDDFCVSTADLWTALRKTRPTAMREVTIEVPKVLWSDIGGQEDIKQKFKESVEWPLKHPEAFTEINIDPPKGVLLYGPPGCSKTMIARALATESGLNFIAVKGPELFSKYVGDSERAVRQVFDRARATAPSIIFFDEIDALAVQRKSEGASVADRVLAQLLTEMGGVESLKDVLVVAATNRPDMIDEALLRPGRIDRMLYVPLPDANTRRKIFELRLKKSLVADDIVLDDLVTLTDGYSGAEVVALCQEAGMNVLRENIESRCVHQCHFLQALTVVKPKTNKDLLTLYERYNST